MRRSLGHLQNFEVDEQNVLAVIPFCCIRATATWVFVNDDSVYVSGGSEDLELFAKFPSIALPIDHVEPLANDATDALSDILRTGRLEARSTLFFHRRVRVLQVLLALPLRLGLRDGLI